MRGNLEFGRITGNPPEILPPNTAFNSWFTGAAVDKLVADYGGVDESGDLDQRWVPVSMGGTFVPKTIIDNVTRAGTTTTDFAVPAFIHMVLVYPDGNARAPETVGGFQAGMPRIRWTGRAVQDDYWSMDFEQRLTGFNYPSIQDRNIFDFVNHLYSGTTNRLERDFAARQFSYDQQLLDGRAGFELAYNRQSHDRFDFLPFSSGNDRVVNLDITRFSSLPVPFPQIAGQLPATSVPNPNVGRPVMRASNLRDRFYEFDSRTFRATAFVQFDFSRNDHRWLRQLGTHTLTGLVEDFREDNLSRINQLNVDGVGFDVGTVPILNARYGDFRRQQYGYIYLGPSALDAAGPGDVRLTSGINVPLPRAGYRYSGYYWNHTTRQVLAGEFITRDILFSGARTRREVDSEAAVVQSKWLGNHLVTLFAWRDDRVKAFDRLDPVSGASERLPDGQFDESLLFLKPDPTSDQSGRTFTQSYVLRFPEKALFDLPWGMDLQAHYFESEAFEPAAIGRNIRGEIIGSPAGTTTEYGFAVDLLERRLSLRLNWYETSSANARTTAGGAVGNSINWQRAWAQRYLEAEASGVPIASITGATAAGFTSYQQFYDAILQVYPEPTRSLLQTRIVGSDVEQETIEGLTSTFDFVSKGMEVELVGSITRDWSVALNVARQETVQSNTAPELLAFGNQVVANLESLGLSGVQDSPNLGETATFLGRWNQNVMFPLRSTVAQDGRKSLEQREWRWNLVSTYSFSQGRLKGFAIGGAARWQDKAAVGYPIIRNEDGNLVNDIDNAFFGDSEFDVDGWIRYRRRLFDTIDWRIQLNARNLIGSDSGDLIPVSIDPIGRVSTVRINPGRQFVLTNSFRF